MKQLWFTAISLFFSSLVSAQNNVITTGGDATGSGGSSAYSVGQIDYINNSGANGSENQGVQQPYEFFLVSIEELKGISFSLFPNPTQDELIIKCNGERDGLLFNLSDMNGKILLTGLLRSSETKIRLGELPVANYNLIILKDQKQLNSYKIVKH